MRGLITGASGGIGAATARRLAGAGWDLAVHAHTHPDRGRDLVEELRALGRESFLVTADLADPRSAESVAEAVGTEWDSLDLLVLNAGSYDRKPFAEISDLELDRCLEVNLASGFRWTRALLPLLRRSPAGRIVLVSSILAFTGSRHGTHYAAAKAGMVGFARSLALDSPRRSRSTRSLPAPSTPRSWPATRPRSGPDGTGRSPSGASGPPRRWPRRSPSSRAGKPRISPGRRST